MTVDAVKDGHMVSEGLKLLVVDDEPDLLDLVEIYMEGMGYEVTTCHSGPSAIEVLEENGFDAIISDYEMPEMNGLELLSAIRSRDCHTPFILFTGRGREEVAIEALNNGADYYLQKGTGVKGLFNELSVQIDRFVKAFRDSSNIDCLLSSIEDMILVVGEDERIVFANSISEGMVGLPIGSIVGMSISDIIPPKVVDEGRSVIGPIRHRLIGSTAPPVESRISRGCWDGKGVTVIVTRDKSAELMAERTFKHLFEHISSVNNISLDPHSDKDSWINEVLSIMGEVRGVDRTYVFEIDWDAGVMSNTYEWCAEGISPQIDNLQDFPISESGWWLENLEKGLLVIPWVPDMEDELIRDVLTDQGIKSLIVVPLVHEGGLMGFLGFDSVRSRKDWPSIYSDMLRNVAKLIVIAIKAKVSDDG